MKKARKKRIVKVLGESVTRGSREHKILLAERRHLLARTRDPESAYYGMTLKSLLHKNRKRRISEREIMRIKRKLKKSAKKLHLGAKRTGAYVYGTLGRIVGNGMKTHNEQGQKLYVVLVKGVPLKYQPPFRPGIIYYTKGWAIKKARVFGGEVMSVANYIKYQRDTRREAIRRGYMPKEYLSEAERRLVGNPGGRYRVGGGYKTFTLDEAKREAERIFRTTGNIVSIEEHRPTPQVEPAWKYGIYTGRSVVKNRRRIAGRRRIVRVLGYDVVEGSKKHMRLLAQKRHFDDLQRSERGLRGNPGRLFPASYPPEKKLILFLARREGWKKYKVSRTGTYPFELRIDGVGKNDIQFSGLLKLIAIHSLVNWTSPQVAMMSSYPSMVREGDWSGIRDSSDDAIDNIFYNFVLKPLGVARPVSR